MVKYHDTIEFIFTYKLISQKIVSESWVHKGILNRFKVNKKNQSLPNKQQIQQLSLCFQASSKVSKVPKYRISLAQRRRRYYPLNDRADYRAVLRNDFSLPSFPSCWPIIPPPPLAANYATERTVVTNLHILWISRETSGLWTSRFAKIIMKYAACRANRRYCSS